MTRYNSLAVLFVLFLLTSTATAQVGDVLEVRMPIEPSPVMAEGKVHLAYELHVTNLSWDDAVLTGVHAIASNGGQSLAAIEGRPLRIFTRIAGLDEMPQNDQGVPLNAGATAHIYMWISVEPAGQPSSMNHRFEFIRIFESGDRMAHQFVTAPLLVGPDAVVIGPPVRGGDWWIVDGNGFNSNFTGHRRGSLITTDGRTSLAQRFARDLTRVVDSSVTIGEYEDAEGNASWFGWGEEAVAVADGTVVRIQDGIPEHPFPGRADVPFWTRETLLGNSVVLDIGGGRYAVYGHLQPGLPVEIGERVIRGQTIGLIGNSGSSSGPHLHFQINDDPSPMSGEGLPFEIDSFEVVGQRDGFDSPFEVTTPVQRQRELLIETRVIRFPAN